MFRATTLERFLLLLSDFAAVSICFRGAFWVQFHSGWIADKFDPTRTFDQYWGMGVALNIGWLILFTCAGLYRSWLLMSRTHQILRVLRAVIIGIVLIIICLFAAAAIFVVGCIVTAPKIDTSDIYSLLDQNSIIYDDAGC